MVWRYCRLEHVSGWFAIRELLQECLKMKQRFDWCNLTFGQRTISPEPSGLEALRALPNALSAGENRYRVDLAACRLFDN